MKNLKLYSMMIATAAVTFLASCGGTEEEPKPDPKVNLKTTTGYVSSSQTVNGDTTIKAGIIINHDRKIKNVKFQVTVSGSTFTVKDTSVNDKVVDIDFMRQVISTPGTEGWTFTATDEDGKTGTASFTLTVAAPDPTLIDYVAVTGQENRKIYRLQSSRPSSAFDLDDLGVYSASSTDEGQKDLFDNNSGTGAYAPVWGSKTGAKFVKVTGTIDYATTTKYSQIVNYYNSKTPSASSEALVKDNMYVVQGGSKKRYYLIYVINVADVAGVNDDHVEIKVKTIDITQ
jgi:hypothetical protein